MKGRNTLLRDVILTVSILLVALISFFLVNSAKTEGSFAVVKVNGKVIEKYPLNENGIYPLNGGTNLLVIDDMSAYLKEANCPDKLCVKQGIVKYTGESIICLPNKLTITITGVDNTVDAVI